MALSLELESSYPYIERGILYLRMGQTESAIADFIKALELNPQGKEALENLRALGVAGY